MQYSCHLCNERILCWVWVLYWMDTYGTQTAVHTIKKKKERRRMVDVSLTKYLTCFRITFTLYFRWILYCECRFKGYFFMTWTVRLPGWDYFKQSAAFKILFIKNFIEKKWGLVHKWRPLSSVLLAYKKPQ